MAFHKKLLFAAVGYLTASQYVAALKNSSCDKMMLNAVGKLDACLSEAQTSPGARKSEGLFVKKVDDCEDLFTKWTTRIGRRCNVQISTVLSLTAAVKGLRNEVATLLGLGTPLLTPQQSGFIGLLQGQYDFGGYGLVFSNLDDGFNVDIPSRLTRVGSFFSENLLSSSQVFPATNKPIEQDNDFFDPRHFQHATLVAIWQEPSTINQMLGLKVGVENLWSSNKVSKGCVFLTSYIRLIISFPTIYA
jgi:hypothetical protein